MADRGKIDRLDLSEPTVKRFTEIWHRSIVRTMRSFTSSDDDRFTFFSRILQILCTDKRLSAEDCAAAYRERFNLNASRDDVNYAFRRCGINSPDSRMEIFQWAEVAVPAFVKALESRSNDDFKSYMKLQDRCSNFDFKSKIFCLMLYTKHPEIDANADYRNFEKFGAAKAKQVRRDIEDFVRNVCRIQPRETRRLDASERKIEELENALKQNEILLKDLQDEFDKRLEENHQEEMIEFFSRLNSNQYGCILDEIMSLRSEIKRLRKENVQLPPEIGGLFILVDNLARFVRDNEINPLMKLGTVHELKSGEIGACEYDGTAYASASEVKRVRVISPGWYYKDRNIQIARPRLKECAADDV